MSGGHRILRSTAVVGACTGVSRLLGFVREVLMAYYFGTSLAKSAFDVAFRIPNLFRRLFGEGALSAAFVPVFAETVEKEGRAEANRLAVRALNMLALALAVLVAACMALTTLALLWPGLGAKARAVLPLLRIMLPYTLFICLVALSTGILNAYHRFALPALTPVTLNVVWILTLVAVCPRIGDTPEKRIYGVAWGIFAAGIAQLAIQAPSLRGVGLRMRFDVAWRDPRVRRVVALMAPAALGMGVTQINVVIDGLLALAVGDWAPAALTYAERLIYLPLGMFGTALGTVLLPTFARQSARARPDELRATLGLALRNLVLVMLPASVGLAALAVPIVKLAYVWGGGEFGGQAVPRTARAVAFYAPGLLVFSAHKVLVPVFYAMQDTRTPVRVGVRMVLLNLTLNIIFVLTWPTEFKHAGLALATVLASAMNCLVLGALIHRRVGSPGWRALGRTAAGACAASLAMAVAAWWTCRWVHAAVGEGMGPKMGQLACTLAAVGVAMATYAMLAAVLCRADAARFLRAFRRQG